MISHWKKLYDEYASFEWEVKSILQPDGSMTTPHLTPRPGAEVLVITADGAPSKIVTADKELCDFLESSVRWDLRRGGAYTYCHQKRRTELK